MRHIAQQGADLCEIGKALQMPDAPTVMLGEIVEAKGKQIVELAGYEVAK